MRTYVLWIYTWLLCIHTISYTICIAHAAVVCITCHGIYRMYHISWYTSRIFVWYVCVHMHSYICMCSYAFLYIYHIIHAYISYTFILSIYECIYLWYLYIYVWYLFIVLCNMNIHNIYAFQVRCMNECMYYVIFIYITYTHSWNDTSMRYVRIYKLYIMVMPPLCDEWMHIFLVWHARTLC